MLSAIWIASVTRLVMRNSTTSELLRHRPRRALRHSFLGNVRAIALDEIISIQAVGFARAFGCFTEDCRARACVLSVDGR